MSQAALPILGVLGGVIAPALIYTALNGNTEGVPGWGIPMATDIAFVIGVMAVLGDRVPFAFFYTAQIAWSGIGLAAVCVVLLVAANRMGVRHPLPYALLGILLWLAVLHSGVHATIAGVVAAMTIPARTVLDAPRFLLHSRRILDHFEATRNNRLRSGRWKTPARKRNLLCTNWKRPCIHGSRS